MKMAKNQLKIQKYETFTKFWSFLQPLIEMNSLLPILANLDFCHSSPNELGHCALDVMLTFDVIDIQYFKNW